MTIVFESLGGVPTQASGGGGARISPRIRGRQSALAFGDGAGGASIAVRVTSAPRGTEPPPPTALAQGSTGIYVAPYGVGYDPAGAGGGTHVRMRVGGRRTIQAGDAAGRATVAVRVVGNEQVRPPPSLDFDLITVIPSIDFFSPIRGQDFAGALAVFNARGSAKSQLSGISRVRSSLKIGQAVFSIWHALAEEGIQFGDESTFQFQAIQRVVDALRLTGSAESYLDAVSMVVAAFAARAMADMYGKEFVQESVSFEDSASSVVSYYANLIASILASAPASHVLTMAALVSESMKIGGEAASVAQFAELIREGLAVSIRLNYDGDEHIAYVINTDTKAVSTYSRYPFNSFAKVGGRYYGMTEDGIRELEGESDAGSPINWRLRLAMTNLGRGSMKRMQSAYLGYCSNGALRLQVIVSNPKTGKKDAHFYKLDAQPAEAPQEARLKIGQGLKTVYWGFGLEAIDGASFQADLLELYPIVLDTKMQGQNGGKK